MREKIPLPFCPNACWPTYADMFRKNLSNLHYHILFGVHLTHRNIKAHMVIKLYGSRYMAEILLIQRKTLFNQSIKLYCITLYHIVRLLEINIKIWDPILYFSQRVWVYYYKISYAIWPWPIRVWVYYYKMPYAIWPWP